MFVNLLPQIRTIFFFQSYITLIHSYLIKTKLYIIWVFLVFELGLRGFDFMSIVIEFYKFFFYDLALFLEIGKSAINYFL